jgi:hypothetical protein
VVEKDGVRRVGADAGTNADAAGDVQAYHGSTT